MESDEEREWKSKKVKKSKGEVMSDSDETNHDDNVHHQGWGSSSDYLRI